MTPMSEELERMAGELSLTLQRSIYDPVTPILAALKSAHASGRASGIEEAAQIAEANIHPNVPPEGGDELDGVARYSNSTCKIVAASIRALSEHDREGR